MPLLAFLPSRIGRALLMAIPAEVQNSLRRVRDHGDHACAEAPPVHALGAAASSHPVL
jgi:hypothetical protein